MEGTSSRTYYYIALILGLLFHGTILVFTFEKTYDAYVHMFFAEHYANHWFESWNQKWYTGFTTTSYPPLVHQIIALLSKFVGLKSGFYLWSLGAIFLLVRGAYNFSLIWVNSRAAGIAAILTVFGSAIVEALHIFGQLPSLTGVAFLLNACPEIYKWFRHGRWINFFLALALLTVTTTAHHVSTIFGMVFFVLPVIGTAIIDLCIADNNGNRKISIRDFIQQVIKNFPKAISFGFLVILLTVIVLFPYWYWSKTDPISQVSIPHGSRENFIADPNLGLIFFLIPWGMMLFFIPYLAQRIFIRRNIFLAISISLAFLLGTGGTTPIPKMILGDAAFNILTLDRFTFWATMLSLPFWGAFFETLLFGDFKRYLVNKFTIKGHKLIQALFFIGIVLFNAIIVNLGSIKPFQPDKIDIDPITNFLSSDKHDQWRFMTLGFGDQMAWLSANTNALSVDGNYHSARRLPEMTTRAVERLENAKYQKMEGIGALTDFLSLPEKYHLKYIFSNDKFYEPSLHFYGWSKITTLENNIVVWEYPDVNPLPKLMPDKNIPIVQRWMWGTLPLTCFVIALIVYLLSVTVLYEKPTILLMADYKNGIRKINWNLQLIWFVVVIAILIFGTISFTKNLNSNADPEKLALAYFDALDFKEFDKAYSLLDPDTKPSFEQFMLEISVEDGILASFAKLDSLSFTTQYQDNQALVNTNAHWITSLNEYDSRHQLKMVRKKNKWFIKSMPFEKNIPTNQFFSLPGLTFKNQGRRKAESDDTSREDILDRPELYVNQANLIQNGASWYIVGSLQNMDNVPAFASVEAIIYDNEGKLKDRVKASTIIVHDLLPKEQTPFRIDLTTCENCKAENISLFVKSLVTDKELYKYVGVNQIDYVGNNKIQAEYLNYGTSEINVPQIIYSLFDINHNIYWADQLYLPKGIRPQRKKSFELNLITSDKLSKPDPLRKIFINGAANEDMYHNSSVNNNAKFLRKIGNSWLDIKGNGFVYELNK